MRINRVIGLIGIVLMIAVSAQAAAVILIGEGRNDDSFESSLWEYDGCASNYNDGNDAFAHFWMEDGGSDGEISQLVNIEDLSGNIPFHLSFKVLRPSSVEYNQVFIEISDSDGNTCNTTIPSCAIEDTWHTEGVYCFSFYVDGSSSIKLKLRVEGISGDEAICLDNVSLIAAVPEPATFGLFGIAGGVILLMRRHFLSKVIKMPI